MPDAYKGRFGKDTKDAFAVRTRLAAARLFSHSIIINVPRDEETGLPQVLMKFQKNGGVPRDYVMNLSRMSSAELELLKEIIDLAFELARPLSDHLDAYAEEHKEELSDDFRSRIYRPLPTVVYGKGSLSEYDQGILHGREDVLRRLGFAFGPRRGVSKPGGDVAQPAPKDPGPDDPLASLVLNP